MGDKTIYSSLTKTPNPQFKVENDPIYSTLIGAGESNDKALLNMVVNLKYSDLPRCNSRQLACALR